MTQRYRLTSQADVDVVEAWMYIAQDSVEAADRMVDRFTRTFEFLATHPGVGTAMDQYRPGLRAFSVGSYVVFFLLQDEELLIYRVLHGARNFDDLL
jgi:plasmid stabilization system protein ParE